MRKLLIIGAIILTSLPAITFAALPQSVVGIIPCTAYKDDSDPSKDPSGLNCNSWPEVVEIIQLFINNALIIATLLATLSFTYAGWLYLTSQGDTGKIQQAHKIFLRVLQGFIFMGVAYLIVITILNTIARPDYSRLQ